MTQVSQTCFDLVRAGDKDRFLAALFAPEDKRSHLLALYAFNIEISRIAETVSEPHVGEIRYQWWLDTVDAIYHGEVAAHPVAQALAGAIEAGDLPKHALQNLIKAKIFDLYADPMPSLVDLEGYLGETSSALIQMASLVLGRDLALESAEVAGLAGVAYGLAGVLRSLPRHRAMGKCYVPLDLLKQRQATAADVISGENEAAVGIVLSELRAKIAERMEQAKRLTWTIKPDVMPAYLHVALTQARLAKLEQKREQVLRSGAEISALRTHWILWKAAKAEAF
ncbi:MAG: squalene/phytoene synthase family protein [Alphaproteobacteria bacterium]|nr:squalene/phytoene synthase family protein [Alphaproteobacteria bacterium]